MIIIRIGWRHARDKSISLYDYETNRPPRRIQPQLVLSRQEREELLVEWGASFQEIIESIRSNIKVKNQRRSTVNAIGRYDRWEEMMESAGRKIKRTIGLGGGGHSAHSTQHFYHQYEVENQDKDHFSSLYAHISNNTNNHQLLMYN